LKNLFQTTSIVALAIAAGSILAQASAAAESDAPKVTALPEITITAQKVSENLQRAAIAVTAVKGESLINAGVTTPQGLTNLVPSLQVANAAGPYSLYYLRGVGNFNGNSLSDSAVAVNLDGMFISRPSSNGGLLYDIDRVEVLKGPQGTLYGRNATGGAINIITRKPTLDGFGGDVSASYGNYNAVQLNGAVNAPLGEDVAMRISSQYINHDGYMTDGTNDQDDLAGRIQFLWQASSAVTLHFGGDYYRQRGRGIGSTVLTDANPDRQIGLGDPLSAPAFQSVYFFPAGNTMAPVPNDTYLDNDFYGGYGQADIETGIGTVTAIAGYRGASLDYRSTNPTFLINQTENDDQFSFETRIASHQDQPLRWLAGAYYFQENIDVPNVSYNQQINESLQQYFPNTKSAAFFGRATLDVTDRFRLNAGARYTYEHKTVDGTFYQLALLCDGTVVNPTFPPTNCFGAPYLPNTLVPDPIFAPDGSVIPFQVYGFGSPFPGGPATTPVYLPASSFSVNRVDSWNRVTWRAGVEYDLLENSLLYGSYETGFKSGGFFFTIDDPVYKPENIRAWTLGLKNQFLENRLQVNIEGFWWKYHDQQVSSSSRDSVGSTIFATRNVGQSTNKGIEIETRALLTDTTEISADLQYLDAKYTSFVYLTPNQSPQIPGLVTSIPPVANCPFTLGNPTTLWVQDCSGRRPPEAPKWVASLGVQQTIPLDQSFSVVINARTRYQSKTYTGLEYLAAQLQSSYWMSDASLTLDAMRGYYVTAYVNNIENKDVIGNSFPNPFSAGALVGGSVRPPRTYGVRAGVHF
jgi:iron complex outermembrane recepter protein